VNRIHFTEKCSSLLSQKDTASTIPNVSVHPNLAAVYRRMVEELETLLEDAAHKDEAMELIRLLVEKIVLVPREEGGLDAVLHGDLARILALCSAGAEQAEALQAVSAVRVANSIEAARSSSSSGRQGPKRTEAPVACGVQGL